MKIEVEKSNKSLDKYLSNLGGILGGLIILSILFVLFPGFLIALLFAYFKYLTSSQIWGTMILGSALIYYVVYLYKKDFRKSTLIYLFASGSMAVVAVILTLFIGTETFFVRTLGHLFGDYNLAHLNKEVVYYQMDPNKRSDETASVKYNEMFLPSVYLYYHYAPSERKIVDEYMQILKEIYLVDNNLEGMLDKLRENKARILSNPRKVDGKDYYVSNYNPEGLNGILELSEIEEFYTKKSESLRSAYGVIQNSKDYKELTSAFCTLAIISHNCP